MAERPAFRMPSLGADMTVGTVVVWHVQPGDTVAPGDIVALVDTEKAEIDVETFDGGTIDELVVPPGEQVPVGTVLAYFRAPTTAPGPQAPEPAAPQPPGAAPPPLPKPTALPTPAPLPVVAPSVAGPSGAQHVQPRIVSPLVRRLAEARHLDVAHLEGSGPGHRVLRADVDALPRARISPRARRLAAEAGIDPSTLTGTGVDGAVVGEDVRRAATSTGRPNDAPTVPAAEPVPTAEPARAADPAVRIRRAIGEMMARSWREIPHYHLSTRIELSRSLEWMARTNEERPLRDRLLPAALLLKATATAAARHPSLNGCWRDGTYVPATGVDLGVVVALRGGGLLAPTIGGADRLSLTELMAALRDVVGRARRGRLRSGDTIPASITVTNLGELGVDAVFGVIHPPQVALVGFGAIHEEAWASNGMVAARPIVQATLAGDHRVSDGLSGAAFLATIAELLKDPEQL